MFVSMLQHSVYNICLFVCFFFVNFLAVIFCRLYATMKTQDLLLMFVCFFFGIWLVCLSCHFNNPYKCRHFRAIERHVICSVVYWIASASDDGNIVKIEFNINKLWKNWMCIFCLFFFYICVYIFVFFFQSC